jgi:hypothetical protein
MHPISASPKLPWAMINTPITSDTFLRLHPRRLFAVVRRSVVVQHSSKDFAALR